MWNFARVPRPLRSRDLSDQTDNSETLSMSPDQDQTEPDSRDTERQPIADLESTLNYITTMPGLFLFDFLTGFFHLKFDLVT
jgi:hypothetical protein